MSNDPAAPLDLDDEAGDALPDPETTGGDVRADLRAAQQAGDVGRLHQCLAAHPELEFTEDADVLAILAVVRGLMQQGEAARQCLAELDPDALSDTAARADYGLALFMTGESETAAGVLQDACARGDAGFEAFMRLGALEVTRENLDDAAEAFEAARVRAPHKAEIVSNLGGVKLRLGAYQEAVEFYDQALALNPNLPQPREMRAKALLQLDRADEMIDEAQQALDQAPDQPMRHLHLATVQMQAEHWAQAEATLNAAIDRFPERDDLKRALVNLLQQQKATNRLGLKLKEWAVARDDPDWTWLALNRARIEARFLDAAERSLDEIGETQLAEEPVYPVLRAKILVEQARADEAVDVLYEAIERFPGNAEARNLLAHTLTSLGRLDEAEGFYDDTAATNPMAIVRHVEGQGNQADDTEIDQLEKLFAAPQLEADAKARVGFTLATARDKRKEYERAFAVLNDANALARRRLNYDWRQHRQFTQRQIDTITPEVVESLQGLGCDWSNRPIFVVGMPRSGTTLTEQILCSHPDVYGAGELNWVPRLRSLMPKVVAGGKHYPDALAAMTERNLKSAAKYYLDKVAAQENESPRTVDKLPHNFDNVALIALMFPNSPIVHLDRDVRDVAVSNYYQNYAAAQGLMGFAYDLRDIGHMLNDHDRIMQHWHALFPGRIYELNYQRLTTDPESTIADLLAFCGLEWDDRVMRFYETQRPVRTASIRQVREGIYTSSTAKWRRYADFLDPLEEVLAEGYKPLDEAEPNVRYQNVIAGPTGAA